jgi:hypothetical protein
MASLIPVGAAIVGGLFSKKAKDKEASRIGTATRAGTAQLAPFQGTGVSANQAQANLLGLGDDAAGDAAFQRFQESSGFQSQLRAGSQAITGNQAARGLLSSGSTLKRLSTFGSDLAKQGFSSFLGQLGGVANRGLSAAQGSAQLITGGGVREAGARQEGTAGAISGFGQAFGGLGDAAGEFAESTGRGFSDLAMSFI